MLCFAHLQTLDAQMIFDTLDISGVEIFSNFPEKTSVFKVMQIDTFLVSNHASQSMAELLSGTTPLFIKNYGPGSLATSSLRGAAATHTQVLWNGMNINSPMPGQTDFSQIPVFFADNVRINFGGGSMTQTSGGLGGSVEIDNKINWNNSLNLEITGEAGSFDTWKTLIRANVGNRKFQSATRAIIAFSENNYPYMNNALNRENPPMEYRQNAAWKQQGLLQEFSAKILESTTVTARLWVQDNHREIPPNIQVTVPDENEKLAEFFVRGQASVEHFSETSKISFQSGYSENRMNYQNKISEIDDGNSVNSFTNTMKYENYKFDKLTFTSSLAYNVHTVNSDNYEARKERNEASIFLGLNYNVTHFLLLNTSVRQELIDDKLAPFTPSLGGKLRLSRSEPWFFKVNIARNFHAPTLNDLYWLPGGNPNLKFEKGFTAEAGSSIEKKIGRWDVSAELTGFISDIDNWIMWQPDSVYSFWTPVNLKHVVSKGLETGIKLTTFWNTINLNYSYNYSFTQVQNKKGISNDDLSIDKQLVYVPVHAANQNIRLVYRHFMLNYALTFTGERYTASDNSRYLPSFTTHDLNLSKTVFFGKSSLMFRFDIQNIFDKSYQAIAWQPMPGRSFNFSMKYSFVKKAEP